jgi:hypothetical protein
LIAGDYTYTVTDSKGCVASTTAIINAAPSELTLLATATQPSCSGQLGSIVLSATGGDGNYTYSTNPTQNLSTGTYSYYVSDGNGCVANASATIVAAPSLLTLLATATQPQCNGQLGSVDLQAAGGVGGYIFGNTPTVALIAGTYNYSVSDGNGCIATSSATIVSAPSTLTLTAVATQPQCYGQSGSVNLQAIGGAGSYTYGSAPTLNLSAGTYSYTVSDGNGCIAAASATIVAAPSLLTLSAIASQTTMLWTIGKR